MIGAEASNGEFTKTLSEMYNVLSSGLSHTHIRINFNTIKTLESSSFLYALVELLVEKGLLSIEELDERKKEVAERLVRKFTESGIGLMYQNPEYEKYSFKHEARVDCHSRLHICKAICCKFPFALSRQGRTWRMCLINWTYYDINADIILQKGETCHDKPYWMRRAPCIMSLSWELSEKR